MVRRPPVVPSRVSLFASVHFVNILQPCLSHFPSGGASSVVDHVDRHSTSPYTFARSRACDGRPLPCRFSSCRAPPCRIGDPSVSPTIFIPRKHDLAVVMFAPSSLCLAAGLFTNRGLEQQALGCDETVTGRGSLISTSRVKAVATSLINKTLNRKHSRTTPAAVVLKVGMIVGE